MPSKATAGPQGSVRKHLALQLAHTPELVYLADLAAEDEDQGRVIDPDDDDDDRRDGTRIEGRGIESRRVITEGLARELERGAAEEGGHLGRFRPESPDGEVLVQGKEHQRDEREREQPA